MNRSEKYKVVVSEQAKQMIGVHIRFIAQVNKDTERNKKKEISMLKINEYAYNACERNGTLESYALFEKRICEQIGRAHV